MSVSVEEVYELSKMLHDSYHIMKKIDIEAAMVLINMASNVMDLIDNTRFTKEESTDIDRIVEELDE